MNTKHFISRICIIAALIFLVVGLPSLSAGATSAGTAFTYQGQLTQGGSAVTGSCDFHFSLWDSLSGGSQVLGTMTLTLTGVTVTNGLFTVQLDFGVGAFTGSARWLEIGVKCAGDSTFTTLTPRQELTPAPYALYAPAAGNATNFSGTLSGDVTGAQGATSVTKLRGYTVASTAPTSGQVLQYNGSQWTPASALTAFWNLNGNSGTVAGTKFLGTLDNVALEFKVNNSRALRLEPNATSPNILGGYSGNSILAGVVGAVISGGGASGELNLVTDAYGVVGGGMYNQAGDNGGTTSDNPYATVGGGYDNYATKNSATVGGGHGNNSDGNNATIGGGYMNNASSAYATIGGGWNNTASGSSAIVGGGDHNTASGVGAFIGGGGYDGTTTSGNTAAAKAATIGGGLGNNVISGADYATVGGGSSNTASGGSATISGGWGNNASGYNVTIGGGNSNAASGSVSTISGGATNTASGAGAVIGGGGWDGTNWSGNTVAAKAATIGGGLGNQVYTSGYYATIGGGQGNLASGQDSMVGGGNSNVANGNNSTVGGGTANNASGAGAFIGGGGYDGTTSSGNTAAAKAATIAGGLGNSIISGADYATVGGGGDNTASNYYATVGGGLSNTASGYISIIGGGTDNQANGYESTVGGGSNNTASKDFATVAGGYQAAATHYGEMAHASGFFATNGDAQASEYVLRNTTTNASYTELFLDGSSARITLATDRTLSFDILIVAHSDNGKSAGYQITGLIANVGGTTAIVGIPTVTVLGEDVAAWDAAVAADDANDALTIEVKGAASANTRWVASVRTVEVGW